MVTEQQGGHQPRLGRGTRSDLFFKILFAVCCMVSAYYTLSFLDIPLLELNGYRQTQTALSSYYILKQGVSLNYWTPAYGLGWSVPLEFPIYHSLVAGVTRLSGLPLDMAGRLVSWLFTLACTVPLYFSLKKTGFNTGARYTAIAGFISAPLYIFWSGTFLIESTALFFALCFVYYAIDAVQGQASNAALAKMAWWLSLALLQKITTVLPLLTIVFVILAINLIRSSRVRHPAYLLKMALATGLPLLLGYLWIAYSDHIKELNPIGTMLTSQALKTWNFGWLEQRFSTGLWIDVVLTRMLVHNGAGLLGITALILGIWEAGPGQRRNSMVLLLVAALLPLLVFSNLHIVHGYYQFSCTVFLVVAVAVALMTAAGGLRTRLPVLYCATALVLVCINIYAFVSTDLYGKEHTRTNGLTKELMDVTTAVQQQTSPDQYVAWYGVDWSTDWAYYAQRKSLTAPGRLGLDFDTLAEPKKYLPDAPTVIVICQKDPGVDYASLTRYVESHYAILHKELIQSCTIMRVASRTPPATAHEARG
jgi:4-amino-4-deoxy-L-arabinose transferase-like glycosyltransferase